MILADDVLLLIPDDGTGAPREEGVRLEGVLAGVLLTAADASELS